VQHPLDEVKHQDNFIVTQLFVINYDNIVEEKAKKSQKNTYPCLCEERSDEAIFTTG
jgi:hypothetical protein